jgi:(2Fe-2S) ferredoxin
MSKQPKQLPKSKYKSLNKLSDRHTNNSDQTVQGRYLEGLRSKKGRLKWLKLETNQGQIVIKVAKEIAAELQTQIQIGDELKIWVEWHDHYLKTQQVLPLHSNNAFNVNSPMVDLSIAPATPKTKLKICRKGSCCKRGSLQVIKAMEAAIVKHSLEDQITIETTGCMDRCKKGPNIKAVPEGKWYDRVQPSDAEDMIKKMSVFEMSS